MKFRDVDTIRVRMTMESCAIQKLDKNLIPFRLYMFCVEYGSVDAWQRTLT